VKNVKKLKAMNMLYSRSDFLNNALHSSTVPIANKKFQSKISKPLRKEPTRLDL
jgi:hypothetical protein